jgi:periplasmic divalent cation tolerance protein
MKLIILLSTFSSIDEANKISKLAIESKIAACANIFPINSMYSWHEKIENHDEYLVIYKTTDKKIKQLRQFLEENHSYEIPEIIDFELNHTNSKYLDWIIQSTQSI